VHLEVAAEDAFTDIVARGFDAGVRLGESVQRDIVAVRITPDLRAAIVGSPGAPARRRRTICESTPASATSRRRAAPFTGGNSSVVPRGSMSRSTGRSRSTTRT
jgi:DNA-binding transcriptional LysR family regulator